MKKYILLLVSLLVLATDIRADDFEQSSTETTQPEEVNSEEFVTLSIYIQSYYSTGIIKEACNVGDEYLKLAEETFSILNYKDFEKNYILGDVYKARMLSAKIFDQEIKLFDYKKDLWCAFIAASPYDAVVDSGMKLIANINKYADKTEYKDSYNKFKKTIISYIPKMMANEERKEELTKYLASFK